MVKFFGFYIFILSFLIYTGQISAQKKDRIETFPRIVKSAVKNCKTLKLGEVIFYLEPNYPLDAQKARIGGAIEVTVKVDEKGRVSELEKVSGNRLLQGAASDAAIKIKFSPTICDDVPIAATGVVTYSFIPFVAAQSYFTPANIEDFPDVKNDSEIYEAIVNITENYKIAFGYEDKKFYTDAPLTRGDFAHFLQLTLDFISVRAKSANKVPRQINLFSSNNPNRLLSFDKIKVSDKNPPFLESLKTLLFKYDISLADEKNEFDGKLPLTQNQLIDLWTKIFGEEAVPVNFQKLEGVNKIITRGEFALFLQESLGVLTYKVLP